MPIPVQSFFRQPQTSTQPRPPQLGPRLAPPSATKPSTRPAPYSLLQHVGFPSTKPSKSKQISNCPDGSACSSPDCFLKHPCTGLGCGHNGKVYLTSDHFKYGKHKRFKYCKEERERAAKYNAINNPINNPKYNPINNPISNAKVQERARKENEERIGKMGHDEAILSPADAAQLAEELMGITDEGYPCMVDAAAPVPAFHVGYTGRAIVDEYLRWLTARGENMRPVLLWDDGATISMKEAERQLDFKYVEIYSSTMKLNARRVEEALQNRFQHLPLGVRLWRYPDKGSKYDTEVDKGKVHKVFISFSPRVAEMLRERIIKVDF